MKARAVNCESDIMISEGEIARLGRGAVTGRIKRRLWDERIDEIPIRISIGNTPREYPDMFLQTFPYSASLEEMRGYSLIVSESAYGTLLKNGYLGGRQNISWKIHLFKEGYDGVFL